MVDVSIIVVSFNTRELLGACLASIHQAQFNGSREVLVVDNASADGSPDMVAEQFPAARLMRNAENRQALLLQRDDRIHPIRRLCAHRHGNGQRGDRGDDDQRDCRP